MRHHVSIKKLSQCETLLPGFSKLWKAIKADTGTTQRAPKSFSFTDKPWPAIMNDGECGRRYALNLETMELSGRLHMSSGDWGIPGVSNNDQAIESVPANAAVVTVIWHDYYRSFSVEFQVAALPAQLQAAG